MVFRVIVHGADEGGFWAEVPALPGCYSQGETLEDLQNHVRESIVAYLGQNEITKAPDGASILEIAI